MKKRTPNGRPRQPKTTDKTTARLGDAAVAPDKPEGPPGGAIDYPNKGARGKGMRGDMTPASEPGRIEKGDIGKTGPRGYNRKSATQN